MFEFFFNEYYEKVYKVANRKLKWYEILMLIFLFVSTIVLLLSTMLNWSKIITAISLIVAMITALVIWIYTKTRNKKDQIVLLNKYKNERIKSLIDFMKKWDDNFYGLSGIDWALTCAKNKLKNNRFIEDIKAIGKTTYMCVFPIITLFLGAAIEKITFDQLVSFLVPLIFAIVSVIALGVSLKSLLEMILTPHRFALEILCDDLEYIKVILQGEINNSEIK